MAHLDSRSMVTLCTPSFNCTKVPSVPALLPSVIISRVPRTGSSSLLETALPRATLVVPAGARKGGLGRPDGLSRLGTLGGSGVPSNNGLGRTMGKGANFGAWAAALEPAAARTRIKDRSFTIQATLVQGYK